MIYFFRMAQDYFSDIETSSDKAADHADEGRTIRNIPISVNRDRANPRPSTSSAHRMAQPRRAAHGSPRRSPLPFVWGIGALLVLVIAGIGVVTVFRKSSITIQPRVHTVVFDESATYQALPKSEAQGNTLAYDIAEITIEEKTTVTASGTERVEEYAKGTITVYNDFSDKPVRLIKNTRFETPDGKTFRVRASITVPGKTASGPGTLDTTVFADQPGPEFNIGPTQRFALPGLKTGAPDMFEKVYASSAAAMTGGYKGDRPIVAESDLNKASESLRNVLKAKALDAVAASVPSEAFTFPQLLAISYETLPPEGEGASTQVGEKATVRLPYIDRALFARAIASATSADAGEGDILIPNKDTFTIALSSSTPTLPGPVAFTLSGTATFVWKVDPAQMAADLAGKDKAAFQTIVQNHPGVESAEAFLRPFWRGTFPSDPAKIVVTVGNPQ